VIELRMARLAPIQPGISEAAPQQAATTLAFSYLYLFRRIVVGLAIVSAIVAFAEQWTALGAAFVTIAIGEWIESSYYLNVLHWRQRRWVTSNRARDRQCAADSAAGSVGTFGSSQATTSSTSAVANTPMKTA
jgi:hypothetical protein